MKFDLIIILKLLKNYYSFLLNIAKQENFSVIYTKMPAIIYCSFLIDLIDPDKYHY